MSTFTKVAIIALVIGIVGFIAVSTSGTTEGFWNLPSRTWKVERVLNEGPDFYQVPTFQSILSPRFSNVNYGPYIRAQPPSCAMTGVPVDPLSTGGCAVGGCRDATIVEGFDDSPPRSTYPSGYANGDYERVSASLREGDLGFDEPEYERAEFLTADGELRQPIVYDRFLYANRHSRLRSQGDWIRGDLPIVPNTGNWFVPSVHPNIDLNAGAINVLAGVNNETNHQLASLIYNSSGGGDTTIGGVDLEPMGETSAFSRMNMGNAYREATTSAGGDVIVTSFP